jgi:hypothetical protein
MRMAERQVEASQIHHVPAFRNDRVTAIAFGFGCWQNVDARHAPCLLQLGMAFESATLEVNGDDRSVRDHGEIQVAGATRRHS